MTKDPADKFVRILDKLSRLQPTYQVGETHGLKLITLRIFFYIWENPDVSVVDISKHFEMPRATAGRLLSNLTSESQSTAKGRKGLSWVDVTPSEADHRYVSVRVSPLGEEVINIIRGILKEDTGEDE